MRLFARLRAVVLGALLLASVGVTPARADLTTCADVYVIRLFIDTAGVVQVMFGNSPTDTSGSYFQYMPGGLSDRVYQSIYAMLLTAKSGKLPVSIATTATGGCGITVGSTSIANVELRPTS